MADSNGDSTLIKVAVFGLTMSIVCTLMISLMFVESGDYSYDDISAYRNELISFSGESMLNESPWVLVSVYEPWNNTLDAATHTDGDGWLHGESIDDYEYLNKSAGIKLDPDQKSNVPLSYSKESASYVTQSKKWWADVPVIGWVGKNIGFDQYEYTTHTSDNWNYTGYRYVFDPTLPFRSTETKSSVDGSLSLIWYTYNGQEGLSGGLDIYNGSVKLASYSATDIINDYNVTSGYATVYVFDFGGVTLNLSIKFDQNVIENGTSLMQAWSNGDWAMAISSVSAGNFLDIENSTSYSTSIGSMIKTFSQIYTFDTPSVDNPWMDMILWLLVGLPMTVALLIVVIRVVSAVTP